VSEARRLKEVQSENAKLKRLLADAIRGQAALKDLLAKSSDTRHKAGNCGSSLGVSRDKRTAGVRCDQCRSQKHALPFHAGR
jgi:hypothetical protein